MQHALIDSVLVMATAFRDGFNDVASLHGLSVFFAEELGTLMCGDDEPWVPACM